MPGQLAAPNEKSSRFGRLARQSKSGALEEKDGSDFQGHVGRFPVPKTFGTGAAESGLQDGP